MNNYINLDGKRYLTPHKRFNAMPAKLSTVRKTLAGATDVTFGPAIFTEWQGVIEAPITPISGSYGTIADLRTSLAKTVSVGLTDHYATSYTVYIVGGPYTEESFTSMWDGASNVFYVPVRLVKA